MEVLNRKIDLHAARHVEEHAGAYLRTVQRGEFLPAENCLFAHEVFAEKLRVLGGGLLKRQPDHAFLPQRIGSEITGEKLIVGEDHLPRDRIKAARTFEKIFARRFVDRKWRRI